MKRLIPCLLLTITLPLAAQLSLDSKDREGKPILINSDAMDVDIEKGIATFYGNVVVNDPDVIITCKKMVLYQEPKEKDKAKRKKVKTKKDSSKDPLSGENTKLERIECIDDVVITRKNTGEKSQWGTCGKAIYYHKQGTITMTIVPVLYQDDSKITGTRLTFFRDSKRIEGTDIKISARNLDEEKELSKDPSKRKKIQEKNPDADAVDDFYKDEKEETPKVEKTAEPKKKVTRKLTQKEADALLGLDQPAK